MASDTKPDEITVPTSAEGLRDLVKRAAKGDRTTLPAIRKLLENPTYIGMFSGNMAQYVEESFVKSLCDKDLAIQEAIYAKLRTLRNEPLGSDSTPMERLLVERIAACWLQVQDAELRYLQNQKDMTLRQADFHQRRMDATHRRYLSALKALALVRKLAIPALQINLARKQVNVVAQPALTE